MREKKERRVRVLSISCVCVCVCGRESLRVALSSPRLSAGSVGFGADCDVTADSLSCSPSHITLSVCPTVCVSLRAGWWRTFQSAVEAS